MFALKRFGAEKERKMFALKSFSESKLKVETENQVALKMETGKVCVLKLVAKPKL